MFEDFQQHRFNPISVVCKVTAVGRDGPPVAPTVRFLHRLQ
jgi:hypothetical protein